jgi:hypothetical protein
MVIAVWWPLVLALVVVAGSVAVVVGRARTRPWWAVASATRWEIRPPARMPPDGAAALWRILLGHLAAGGHA